MEEHFRMEEHFASGQEQNRPPPELKSLTDAIVVKDNMGNAAVKSVVIEMRESSSDTSSDEYDGANKRDFRTWRDFILPVNGYEAEIEDNLKIKETEDSQRRSGFEKGEDLRGKSKMYENSSVVHRRMAMKEPEALVIKGNDPSGHEKHVRKCRKKWEDCDYKVGNRKSSYVHNAFESNIQHTSKVAQHFSDEKSHRREMEMQGSNDDIYQNVKIAHVVDVRCATSAILEDLRMIKEKAFSVQTIYENLLIEIGFIRKFIEDETNLIYCRTR